MPCDRRDRLRFSPEGVGRKGEGSEKKSRGKTSLAARVWVWAVVRAHRMQLNTPPPTGQLPWQPPWASPAPITHKLLQQDPLRSEVSLTLSEPGWLPDREPVNGTGIAARVEREGPPQVLDVAVLRSQARPLQGDVLGRRANHCSS